MSRWKCMSCGVHQHSDLGSPDGGSTIKGIVERSIQLGRTHVCLTDHGSMTGLAALWDVCAEKRSDKKNPYNIHPIHGIEAYINTPWDEPKILKNGKVELGYSHLTIHFRTKQAYEYMCRLTPIMEQRAVVKYGEKKPIMTLDELRDIADQITIGSGCLGANIAKAARRGDFETAEKIYCTFREMVGQDNWFVELMPHRLTNNWVRPETSESGDILREGYFKDNEPDEECGGPLDVQRKPNLFILHLARKYRDRILVSEDGHLGHPDDYLTQIVRMGNGKDAWRFSIPYAQMNEDHWFQELRKQLGSEFTDAEFESWIDNSHFFATRFADYTFDTIKNRAVMPTVQSVFGSHEVRSAKELIFNAIQEEGRMPAPGTPEFPIYFQRLKEEIEVIADNGRANYLPYFLQVRRVVREMRERKNLATPRGSAGGSLLLYLIGVSVADPIKYKLSFGRFLTLGRIQGGSMPDIDVDFSQQSQVFEFLRSEYGDRFSRVTNYMNMKLKSTIKDVERLMHGRVSQETARMCKILPDTPQGMDDYKFVYGYTDKDSGAHVPGLLEVIEVDGQVTGYKAGIEEDGVPELVGWVQKNPDMWKTVEQCLGTARGTGVHACATLLAPESISRYVPVSINKDGYQVSMYNGKYAEKVGMMKFDFLGVDALASLSETTKMIERDLGISIPWCEYPHDPAVYESIVGQNNLSGIFQLSARAIKPYAIRMQPRSIVEVSNIVALIRPGALDAPPPDPKWEPPQGKPKTAVEYYIAVKDGHAKPYYFHPDMESIVKDTYSVVLFQEQLIEIFKKIGGMSDADADEARRACGKKDKALLEKTLDKLVPGAVARGWTAEQINILKATVMASARYSFNLSHSNAYAILGYNEMYLKHHYPAYFWAGKLSTQIDKEEKLMAHVVECWQLLRQPSVVSSKVAEITVEEKQWLRLPLSVIKGVGDAAASVVHEIFCGWQGDHSVHAVYAALHDAKRSGKRVDVGAIAALALCGAFDEVVGYPLRGQLFQDFMSAVKTALGSTAAGRTTKGSTKWSDVKTEEQAIIWRRQNNPLYVASLWREYSPDLELIGFASTGTVTRVMQRPGYDLIDSFRCVTQSTGHAEYYAHPNSPVCATVCVVLEATPFLGGRGTRLKLWTGQDTAEVTYWNNKDGTSPLPEGVAGTVQLVVFKPSVKGDRVYLNGREIHQLGRTA